MSFSSLPNNMFANDDSSVVLPVAVVAVSIVVGWLGIQYVQRVSILQSDKFQHLPPAPANMGILEFLMQLLGSNGPQFALKMARTDGMGYIFRTPGLPSLVRPHAWISIGEPRLGRLVLEDPQSTKPSEAYEVFDRAVGGGQSFFTSNGSRANHVRKSTAAAFSTKSVQIMATVVDQVLEEWMTNRLEPLYVTTGKPIDFDDEIMIVTTAVIAQAGFDYALSSDDRIEFATKMRTIMEVFFHQNLSLPRKLMGCLFPDIRRARRMAVELKDKFGYGILNAARNKNNHSRKSHANNSGHSNTIVNLMLQDNDYENDEERARDILLYFFAGFETTAHTIAYCLLELAKNPREQTALRTKLSEYATRTDHQEDRYQCPQLKRVVRETLRLHPAAALGSTRVAAREIQVPKEPPFRCGDSVDGDTTKTSQNDSREY